MKRPHQMSRPQSRVGLGQGREGSGTARHNILANHPRLGNLSDEVQVIRHMEIGSFPQDERSALRASIQRVAIVLTFIGPWNKVCGSPE